MTFKNLASLMLVFLLVQHIDAQQAADLDVLVFSKTERNRHKSIPSGIQALSIMGFKNQWKIDFSEDGSVFSEKGLSNYDVIVFLNTTGNVLLDAEKEALKDFFARGKGFVGIHSASDTENEWSWYTEMIGGTFKNHPKIQEASHIINVECEHPAIKEFNTVEKFTDEWYNFRKPVGKHVNVLARLDESTYEGGDMGDHPITWYHHYDGGRVFYTGLGHSIHTFSDQRFLQEVEGGILWTAGLSEVPGPAKEWTNLLAGDPYKNWDVFMGAPHKTVKGLDSIDPYSDGKNSTPLGLNNDPKEVFTFQTVDGEQVMHISGEIYGALTSKREYGNYHLKLQFKWGEKVWEPRLTRERDSGILYHCVGPYRSFWNVWMQSQEFQVQEGDMGDYHSLSGTFIDIPSTRQEGEEEFDYTQKGALQKFSSAEKQFPGHCNKGFDNEKPHGEWNTLELICFEGTSLHIVNGKVVMALFNSRIQDADKNIIPLQKGRIQIQSEAAEAYYKNIEIKSIDKIPSKFAAYINQ
jgi:type 1 glutamine amidotransferase